MKKHLLLLFTALLPLVASAQAKVEIDGIYYNITSEADKTAEVTYKGDNYWGYDEYSGSITIPATVELGGAPMTVAITNAVMEEGVSLKVHLETDFTARTAEGAVKSFPINGGAVQRGDVVLTVGAGDIFRAGEALLAGK